MILAAEGADDGRRRVAGRGGGGQGRGARHGARPLRHGGVPEVEEGAWVGRAQALAFCALMLGAPVAVPLLVEWILA